MPLKSKQSRSRAKNLQKKYPKVTMEDVTHLELESSMTLTSQVANAEAVGIGYCVSESSCHHAMLGHPADAANDPQPERPFFVFELDEDLPDLGDIVDSEGEEDEEDGEEWKVQNEEVHDDAGLANFVKVLENAQRAAQKAEQEKERNQKRPKKYLRNAPRTVRRKLEMGRHLAAKGYPSVEVLFSHQKARAEARKTAASAIVDLSRETDSSVSCTLCSLLFPSVAD
jgi:hypothetical protein